MRLLIVGPGAMGLLFSARLKRFTAGDVSLLDYKKERASFLNRKGIKVEGIKGEFCVNVPVFTKEDISFRPDFVLIFVKAYSTEKVAYVLKGLIKEDTRVITLQNGIGNIEILERILKRRVYGGITSEGATLLKEGHVRHAGTGETVIGPYDEMISELRFILNKAGFKTRITSDIEPFIWGKLLINSAINPLTAITGFKNGMLIKIDWTRRIMEECIRETEKVIKRKGIKLPYEDPVKKVYEVCEKTAENTSSMLQDIIRKKKTEIDFINGAIIREAEKMNISVPVNKVLTYLVKAIQDVKGS